MQIVCNGSSITLIGTVTEMWSQFLRTYFQFESLLDSFFMHNLLMWTVTECTRTSREISEYRLNQYRWNSWSEKKSEKPTRRTKIAKNRQYFECPCSILTILFRSVSTTRPLGVYLQIIGTGHSCQSIVHFNVSVLLLNFITIRQYVFAFTDDDEFRWYNLTLFHRLSISSLFPKHNCNGH